MCNFFVLEKGQHRNARCSKKGLFQRAIFSAAEESIYLFQFLVALARTNNHSSTLAWKIPRMEESGRLQYMGLLRVGHD